jgi:murein DD-endopeptidase MepM/ murein hydrolase activator NlpD
MAAPWWSPWQQQTQPRGRPHPLMQSQPRSTIDPRAFMQMLQGAAPNALMRPPAAFGGAPAVHPNSPAALLQRGLQSAPRMTSPVAALAPAAGAIAGPLGQVYNQLFSKDPNRGPDETAPAHVIRQILSGQIGPGQTGADAATAVWTDAKKFVNEITATPKNPGGIFGAGWTATPGQGIGASRDGGARQHRGRDYSGLPVGTPIQAPMSGVVQAVGNQGANGNFVKVKWEDGTTSTIAHLANVPQGLKPGYSIPAGMAFAQAGNSGNASTRGTDRAVLHVTQTDPQGNLIDPNSWMGRIGQMAAAFGAPAPGFDASPYQYAMRAQDAAAEMLMKPTSATFTETPLPDRPELEELPAPDYAAGDAAFSQTAPKNPFDDPKERRRLQKQQYFKGIGQAMASLGGSEGIGTMLMRLGSGALMGRARGDELIDAKEDEFEQQMQLFNRALAAREDNKAVQIANVLHANIQQRNQRADQIWADNVREIEKKQPQVVNGSLITYDRDPENPDKWTMTKTPIDVGPRAEALLNKANIGIQMGQASQENARFAYGAQQATSRTALGLATSMAMQEGNGTAATEGYLAEASNRARAAVQTGSWRSFFNDPNMSARLDRQARLDAYRAAGVEQFKDDGTPMIPLEGSALGVFNENYENILSNLIYNHAAKMNQNNRLFEHSAGRNALVTQRSGNQKTSTRYGPRGATTTQSWSLDD